MQYTVYSLEDLLSILNLTTGSTPQRQHYKTNITETYVNPNITQHLSTDFLSMLILCKNTQNNT